MAKVKVKNNKKVETDPVKRQYMLTLFLLLVPVLIIAFTNELITKILLFFYEGVLLANFIRDKLEADVY